MQEIQTSDQSRPGDQTSHRPDKNEIEHNVQPGERVGIWLKNCSEYLIAFFAILQTGAVVVPINNFFKPDEVLHILRDAGISLLVSESAMASQLEILRAAQPEIRSL